MRSRIYNELRQRYEDKRATRFVLWLGAFVFAYFGLHLLAYLLSQ